MATGPNARAQTSLDCYGSTGPIPARDPPKFILPSVAAGQMRGADVPRLLRLDKTDSGTRPPKIYFEKGEPESLETCRLSSRVKIQTHTHVRGKLNMVAIQGPTEGMGSPSDAEFPVKRADLPRSQQKAAGVCPRTLDRGRKALARAGLPAALIERCAGVRAVVDLGEDVVLTVGHTCRRRRWV